MVQLIDHVLSHPTRLNQAALNSPWDAFLSIFSSSKEQSFITLPLLISHMTIGGCLWLTQAQIQLLVLMTHKAVLPYGGLRLPRLSPTVLLILSPTVSPPCHTLPPSSALSLISFTPRSSLPPAPSVLSPPASLFLTRPMPLCLSLIFKVATRKF